MSNAFAIAAVTAALKLRLRAGIAVNTLETALGGVPTVSALPPDRINPETDPNQLNVFLYSATPNTGWSNHAYPSRSAEGDRVGSPPLALDLHYLVTAYGAADYGAEILLGHAMKVLHEQPFFTRQWLKDNVKPGAAPNDIPAAFTSTGLAEQIEQIKITPKLLTPDDLSRIWTALQGRYRPSAAYLVTVVLIDSTASRRTALPVLSPRVQVLPWSTATLEDATNANGDDLPIKVGDSVTVRGSGLAVDGLQLWLMDLELTNKITRRSESELEFALSAPLPAGLRAGLLPLQVAKPLAGAAVISSNAIALALRPSLTAVSIVSGKLRLVFSPTVAAKQRVVAILNATQSAAGQARASFSLLPPALNGMANADAEGTTINFSLTGVPAGTYLVRAQVDGAESVLTTDVNGVFSGPKITLP